MEPEFVRVTSAEVQVVKFDADRRLSERLTAAADESTESCQFAIRVMPLGDFPALTVRGVQEQMKALPVQPVRHGGGFPDSSHRRTVSRAVVGGYPPFSNYVGASGFVSYVERPSLERAKALYPHWWHPPLVALLRWTASYYEAVEYAAPVRVELELSGIDGVALVWVQHNEASDHRALEPLVLVHETLDIAELVGSEEDVAVRLTLAASAAFNWALPVEQAQKALAS